MYPLDDLAELTDDNDHHAAGVMLPDIDHRSALRYTRAACAWLHSIAADQASRSDPTVAAWLDNLGRRSDDLLNGSLQ
jgi:hypothetical protein